MSQQTDEKKAETLTITVDGRQIEARPGEMVIAAAERGGVYIPRFCWHPRMKPVGMCRMCLVEIKGPRGFALMPSCYVPVADGQEVVTTSDAVKKAQDGVLEFLLINHPLDCPVCDRGGECPLQDQTFAFGPGESRFVEEKRHWAKPIPINPLVNLDRERCIQCARCTRFADEVAGDPLIDFVGRSDVTEVNTFPDQPFVSNFSGNIVQICPVGALTATPYRFRARPWDLEIVESTCTACAVGCRMAIQSSTDRLIRNLGIDSDPVNWGWLCDKGRFGYEPNDHPDRVTTPLVRKGEELVESTWSEALRVACDGLRAVVDTNGPDALAVLGGARLPNEDAYAWAKLTKSVLGTDNVDCQMGDGLPAEAVLGLPRATIDEACRAAAIVVLAPDLKEELPVLYLRLRDAATRDPKNSVPIVEIGPRATGLSRHAAARLLYHPGEAAAVVRALVGAAGGGAVPKAGVGGVAADDIRRAARLLAPDGGGPRDIVVVLGRPSLAESDHGTLEAAAAFATDLPGVRFLPALRRGNVHGALDAGLAPGLLPGRVSLDAGREWFASAWGSVPAGRGLDTKGILEAAAANRVQGLVLVGADPLADFPDRAVARRGLAGVGFTVVIDMFVTDSALHADVVLPVAAYGERTGTTTNLEGRVTRLGQKVTPPGTVRPDWMIAAQLARHLGGDLGFDSLDAIAEEMERLAPAFAGVTPDLLARPGYRDGVVLPLSVHGAEPTEGAHRPTEAIEVEAAMAQGETLLPKPEPERDAATLEPVATAGDGDGAPASPAPTPSGPRPPMVSFAGAGSAPAPRPPDAYSLRLVAPRSMYDGGVLVQHCPSLAPLAARTRLRANPNDLARLGVATGDLVRVTSARAGLVLEAMADPGVPRGSAAVDFNQPGEGAADLIDAAEPVIDVRLETVSRDRRPG